MEGVLKMDTTLAIEALVGLGVKYGGCTEFNTEEEFNNLRWNDERPRPKWKDLVTKWDEIKDIPEPKTKLEELEDSLKEAIERIAKLEGSEVKE